MVAYATGMGITGWPRGREKWENILLLYNRLLIVNYSPIAALNRAYAFARVYGKEAAIPEAEGLKLEGNLFYHSLLGRIVYGGGCRCGNRPF